MRQRKSFSRGNAPNRSSSSSFREDDLEDGSSRSSESDHEDSIRVAHPDEGAIGVSLSSRTTSAISSSSSSPGSSGSSTRRSLWQDLRANNTHWSQCVTIAVAAFLTYSYHTVGATANVQVAIMTTIVFVGATPFVPTHLTTASIGAFVGGHNMIGATERAPLSGASGVAEHLVASYLWLAVQSAIVGLVWCHWITRFRILDGYAGRLGTTTFLGTNLVVLLLWGPLQVLDWNRYWYGFVATVPMAEEDAAAEQSLASAWSWTEEAELALGYVASVLWLGVVSGVTRLQNHRKVQEWHQRYGDHPSAEAPPRPVPLNNVLVPCLWTLASILVANATGYSHAPGLYNGFAVGAYVGMASLQKLPSVAKFASVSLVAAAWGLALTPLCVGFAGKSGFTSMLGHATHELVVERCLPGVLRKRRLRRPSRRESSEPPTPAHDPENNDDDTDDERQRLREAEPAPPNRPVEDEDERHESFSEEPPVAKPPEPYHPPHKPSRKKELVFSTKQQRRQQQRLKQLQQKEQREQQQPPHTATTASRGAQPPLRHRAWVASPADGDGTWEHPQLRTENPSSRRLDVV